MSLVARIIVVRLKNDILPSFWARHGYNTGIKLVFNEDSKMLKVPTPNSNLNLFTFTFHYINPTNAQQMNFPPVNKTVCPLECAALTSRSWKCPNCAPFNPPSRHVIFLQTTADGNLLYGWLAFYIMLSTLSSSSQPMMGLALYRRLRSSRIRVGFRAVEQCTIRWNNAKQKLFDTYCKIQFFS
jgi:hypothetical protein